MALRAEIFEPPRGKNKHPGTAVIEPLGFRGNVTNSKHRLKMVADLVGATVISFERPGTNTTIFDMALKRALHPTRYDQTIADQVDELRDSIASKGRDFDTLVGHGASAGGAPIAALGKLGLFKRILFRDAINLRATDTPEKPFVGIHNFLSYLVRGEKDKPYDPSAPHIPHEPEMTSWLMQTQRTMTEIRHYHPLMLSTYTAVAVHELAEDITLPIHVITFGHTFTGSKEQALAYHELLHRTRTRAHTQAIIDSNMAYAPLLTAYEPDLYHSDLVSRPDVTAHHMRRLLLPVSTH